MTSPPTCAVPGCENIPYSRKYCHMHYSRWRRHGDPNYVIAKRKTTDTSGGFRCPKCSGSTGVTDSRPSALGAIRRRRECQSCGYRFTTGELVEGWQDARTAAALDSTIRVLERQIVLLKRHQLFPAPAEDEPHADA
jgi:hypothetical protein